MARGLHLLEQADHVGLGLEPVVLPPAHLLEVAAGAERRAGAADHDGAHARVALARGEEPPQRFQEHRVERVSPLRAVQRDGRDAVGGRVQDLVGHGVPPGQRKSERAITMRWTSDGPSPMRRTRASRYQRSSGNSFDTPYPPWICTAASITRPSTSLE